VKALILTDGKPGHFNQSVALCKNTGLDYELVEVSYRSKAAKALSYLLDHCGIYTEKLFTSHVPRSTFHILISTGSTSFYPNKVLARKLGLPNIAILNPKGYRPDFSAILCPAYDHPQKKENIIELPLNLCAADPAFFEEKAAEFKTKHAAQAPSVGFIIGGPNAVSTLDAAELGEISDDAFGFRGDMCCVGLISAFPIDIWRTQVADIPVGIADNQCFLCRADFRAVQRVCHECFGAQGKQHGFT